MIILEEGFLTDWIDEFKAAGDLPADFPMEDTEKKAVAGGVIVVRRRKKS